MLQPSSHHMTAIWMVNPEGTQDGNSACLCSHFLQCTLRRRLSGKESSCNAGDTGDMGSIPESGRSPGGRKSYGQRSLTATSNTLRRLRMWKHRTLAPDSWDAYHRKDFSEPRLLHLPTQIKALNSLTWDMWFSLINSNFLFVCFHCNYLVCVAETPIHVS